MPRPKTDDPRLPPKLRTREYNALRRLRQRNADDIQKELELWGDAAAQARRRRGLLVIQGNVKSSAIRSFASVWPSTLHKFVTWGLVKVRHSVNNIPVVIRKLVKKRARSTVTFVQFVEPRVSDALWLHRHNQAWPFAMAVLQEDWARARAVILTLPENTVIHLSALSYWRTYNNATREDPRP